MLRLLAEHAPIGLSVTEIAKELGMQTSTASRLLSTLHDEGVVQRERDERRYSIGLEILRLGRLAAASFDIGDISEPYLHTLAAQTGESVFLALYDRKLQKMVRIRSVASKYPLQYLVELNVWTGIYEGASGLGILAFLNSDERKAVVKAALQENPNAISGYGGVIELEAHLADVRTRGYAHTRGQRIRGAVGFCAPLFDYKGQVVGGVILTMPEGRFDETRVEEIAEHLVATANDITRESGGQAPRLAESAGLMSQNDATS